MKRCAGGILISDGRVLLVKRSPDRKLYPDVWDMVGGHQNDGETIDQTLLREFDEEIGVTPTNFREMMVIAEPYPEINGERAYHVYAITAWRGPEPAIKNDEHTDIAWFTIDEALSLDLALSQYRDVLTCI